MRRELIEPLPVFYRVGPPQPYYIEQLGPASILKGFRDLSPPSSFGRCPKPVGANWELEKRKLGSTNMGKTSTLPFSKISRRFQLGGEGAPFQVTLENKYSSSSQKRKTHASTQTEMEAAEEPEVQRSDACTSPPLTPETILLGSTAGVSEGKLAELEKLTGHIVIQRFFTKADEAFGVWLEKQLVTELGQTTSKASLLEVKAPVRERAADASCSSSRDSIQCECFAKDLEIAAVLQGGLADEFPEILHPPTDDGVEPATALEEQEQETREVEEEIRSSFIENLQMEDAGVRDKDHENLPEGDAVTLRSVSVDSCIGTATDTSSLGTGPMIASNSSTLQKKVMNEVLLENEDEEENLESSLITQPREDNQTQGRLSDLDIISDEGGDADESGSETETETSVQRKEEDEFESVIERHEREKEKRLQLRRRNAGIQTSLASTPSAFSSASSSSFDLEVEEIEVSQRRRSKGRASYLPGGGSGLHLLNLRFQVGREFESELSIRIPPQPPPPTEKGSKGLKGLWGDVKSKMDSRMEDFVVEGNRVPLYPSEETKEEGDKIERSLRRLKHILDQ